MSSAAIPSSSCRDGSRPGGTALRPALPSGHLIRLGAQRGMVTSKALVRRRTGSLVRESLAVVALVTVLVPDGFPRNGQRVHDGDDLATAINGAPARTTFCVEAGTYPTSETVDVQDGDRLVGEPGTTTRRSLAVDPDPVVHVRDRGWPLPHVPHRPAEWNRDRKQHERGEHRRPRQTRRHRRLQREPARLVLLRIIRAIGREPQRQISPD